MTTKFEADCSEAVTIFIVKLEDGQLSLFNYF